MKTVAAISFRDNHSLSMDIEDVRRAEVTVPIQAQDGTWCCELLLRTAHGTVALQMTADEPEHLVVHGPQLE
ncbi:conserved hypothetical protein [Magnetospirillum sp. LM-5]|nr:conserved hypothetical protein [Magnetospirillum sp. LM-5]